MTKLFYAIIATALTLVGAGQALGQQSYAKASANHNESGQVLPEVCTALAGGRFHDLEGAPTHIVSASYTPAQGDVGAYCDVQGYVNPTVNFGLYLPMSNWNGRYLVRGCGGSCGTVAVALACTRHVRDGYACLHTDMGHRSTLSDNNWVDNNLQGLIDFGYRSTHVTTVAGRAILRAFYSGEEKYSYFFACSTGGRQGMVEAQRFPQDFDGIVAIAPASMGPFGPRPDPSLTNPAVFNKDGNGRSILPNRKALLVHRAVVAQCDMNDGVKDGLIGDPRQCPFDPAQLQCKSGNGANCLSAAQVDVVRKINKGAGAQYGSEFNWINHYLQAAPLQGEVAVDEKRQGRGDPIIVDTFNSPSNPDLRPFRNRGGKLIMVHGWDDQSVPPLPSVDYYETMTRTMGGAQPTRAFARLFMVPGMDHCSGGAGAYAINYMGALTDWVEGGQAPEKLIGFHPKPDTELDFFSVDLPRLKPEDFEFSRPHFAYPATARYRGKGDPSQAENFVAVTSGGKE
jgi:pimeloyl-ACP methyl ester carboxylesterase